LLNVILQHARPGMTLALPALHPQSAGHVLLKPGFVLDRQSIDRLTELGVHGLWIRYPGLEAVMRFISPEVLAEHARLTRLLGSGLDRITRDAAAPLAFQPYARAVRALVRKLGDEPTCQMLVADVVRADNRIVTHSSNVCFLSLTMGLKLENYLVLQRRKLSQADARNVENLGVGALLHDIGVLGLDQEVRERYLNTGDEQDRAWQSHVKLGYDRVRHSVEPTAAVAVLQHHQRFDGRGYPAIPVRGGRARPLRGEEIHIFARIIAVAELFDRMRCPLSNAVEAAPAVRALRRLADEARGGAIDPIVFKALLAVAPPYPPGTLVTLNDGFPAVVVGYDPARPCRPIVQEVLCPMSRIDPTDLPLGRVIDLKLAPGLHVAEIGPYEVERDNFEPVEPGEFDLRVLTPPKPAAKPARRRRAA